MRNQNGVEKGEEGDGYHVEALKNGGTVWTWGSGYYGQLGNGALTSTDTPVHVLNLGGVVAIGAGTYDTYAVKSDGALWGCGSVASGGEPFVKQIEGVADAAAVAGGNWFALALRSNVRPWLLDKTILARSATGNTRMGILCRPR